MRTLALIFAALLTGCGDNIRTVYVTPHVPADLRRPVTVSCPSGYSEGVVAACLLRKDAGLSEANRRISTIDQILTEAERTEE